jgi:riboflavin synthase
MFTGIVAELGRVVAVQVLPDAARITVAGPTLQGIGTGDSVAVNGVCLTATDLVDDGFAADMMAETLRRTGLGTLTAGDAVNLEQALTPTSRLGGHIVQGHVDGVGTVTARRPSEHWTEVDVDVPGDLTRYVVAKGSIALDGVSLTVARVMGTTVTVSLIPETLSRTTFGSREIGDAVNVEVDVLAKYVERLLQSRQDTAPAPRSEGPA